MNTGWILTLDTRKATTVRSPTALQATTAVLRCKAKGTRWGGKTTATGEPSVGLCDCDMSARRWSSNQGYYLRIRGG
jgi:hypothetical protein